MKKVRRYLSPVVLSGLGIWMIVNQNATTTIIGIAAIVLSAFGIVTNLTDKESSKASRGVHIGLDAVFAAGGAMLLISPDVLNQYLKYFIGGIVVIYSMTTLRRMFKNQYGKGSKIAECVPAVLGVLLMLIPLDQNVFTPAAGGVMAVTGVITLIGNLFGKPKKKKTGEKVEEKTENEKEQLPEKFS